MTFIKKILNSIKNNNFDDIFELIEISNAEIRGIEASKSLARLAEKTQVLVPVTGRDSITKTRLTHSSEVATSAEVMILTLAKQLNCMPEDIDYQRSVRQTCLLHDIGHPPFGHDGAEYIDETFKARGLKEGFSDNNNNLTVIDKDPLINVRDYVIASVIKYPKKLYESQKDKYLPMLNKAIKQDKKHFSKLGVNLKNMEQTISCQIMDEADRNSYTCSDLIDFYSLGNTTTMEELKKAIDIDTPEQFCYVSEMLEAVNSGDSFKIKSFFEEMKDKFNRNFKLTENGLEPIDKELHKFRESLSAIEYEFFIKPIRSEEFHLNNMKMLEVFINNSLENDFCKSSTYKNKIKNAQTEEERLTYIRDMVSEVSDWFVITTGTQLVNDNVIKQLQENLTKENEIKLKERRLNKKINY